MFKVFGFYKFVQVKSLKRNKVFLQKFLISNHIRGTIIIAKEGLNGTISGSIKDIDKTTKKLKSLFSFKQFDNSNESKSKFQPFHKPKVKIKNEIVTMNLTINSKERDMNSIKIIEKGLLGVIALLTIVATIQEIITIYMVGKVNLPDLLLLFIYTEVLGMIGVFYMSNKIPITLPLFIAMTALSRLIILQGKDMEPSTLIYEAGAILLIAIACLIIRYRPSNQSTEL